MSSEEAGLRSRIAELEAALARAAQDSTLLRSILEHTTDFIFVKDAEHRWIRASRSFEPILNRHRDQILGAVDSDLFPPEVCQHSKVDEEEVLGGTPLIDKVEGGEMVSGQEVWVSTSKNLLKDDTGKVLGILGIARDISVSKARFEKTQQELAQSRRAEALGRMAGGIAHDFNNMLAVIMGLTEVLTVSLPEGDEREDAVEALAACRRARALTQQLLDLSQHSSNETEAVDLNAIIHELDDLIRRSVPPDLRLEQHLATEPVFVGLSRSKAEQVILNLVLNARDALHPGGTLSLATRIEDDYGVLEVADDGIGMPAEIQDSVFEPFFSTKGDAGTGLGLATVQGVIQSAEGQITCVSSEGEGSTFTVRLPRVRPIAPEEADDGESADLLRPRHMLVVDDQVGLLKLVPRLLQDTGFRCTLASSAAEAVSLIAADDPPIDFLLTDIVLGDDSGVNVAEAFRKRHPEADVLFMSGYNEKVLNKRGASTQRVLAKPFSSSDLQEAIAEVIRG